MGINASTARRILCENIAGRCMGFAIRLARGAGSVRTTWEEQSAV